MLTRRMFLQAGAAAAGAMVWPGGAARAVAAAPAPALTPFVDPLPIPPLKTPSEGTAYELSVEAASHRYHRDLPETTVWGYDGIYPGPTFLATRGTPITVTVSNEVTAGAHPFASAFDSTIMGNVDDGRVAVHLHGGETPPASDGNPGDIIVPGSSRVYHYPNSQHGTTLWYHDHAMGNTRLNVMAGLAGFYLLVDPAEEAAIAAANPGKALPTLPYMMGLAIQDRDFFDDGSVDYPIVSDPGSGHDHWIPEYFANTAVVNGKAMPYLEVEPRKYRFRVLNGAQARFFALRLSSGAPITVLGSDGGYLAAPVQVPALLIAPGERYDVVIDFGSLAPGTQITMLNDAAAPFPNGTLFTDDRADTVMNVMQFRVTLPLDTAVPDLPLPTTLRPIAPPVVSPLTPVRSLFLNEVAVETGANAGTVERVLLNDTAFMEPATEKPRIGSTEVWEIANTTMDTHPIHLHLVQFRLLGRQAFRADPYLAQARAVGYPPPVAPYLTTAATLMGRVPRPQESAWKDTVLMHPGEVTRILVKFAPQDASGIPGVNQYPFDPMADPGYVWHCHILEHEENDMMRPLMLGATASGAVTAVNIHASAASARLKRRFVLSGVLTPGRLGDRLIVEVKRPGSSRWSYSSTRLAHEQDGAGARWWYGYVPVQRGVYTFRVRFAGDGDRLGCVSQTVTVRVP